MANLSSFYPQPVLEAGSGITVEGTPTFRTLSDRFGEVFHVDDYGAKGDWNGTTGTDDTAAIQAAINAAVAAGGGVVRFQPNRAYRLDTRTLRTGDTVGFNVAGQRHFLRVGSGNLSSNFGSTEMMLYFDGQGATLHATSFASGSNDIIYVCCQFHTVVFSDLKFTRAPYQITGTGNQSKALAFYPIDTNEHHKVLIQNCFFKDNLASIDFSTWGMNDRSVRGKLKQVDIIGCIFKHDNGTNRIGSLYTSGALCVYMHPWIRVANFDRCWADGQTGGQSSSTYVEPMHGFLFPMPIRANITNCYFTHFCVEVIKASDTETAQTRISIAGNYSQINVGESISRQITVNAHNLQNLEVGKIYGVFEPNLYYAGRGGYYRLDAKTGGGEYNFSIGEELNFTRVSSEPYQLPAYRDLSDLAGSNLSIVDLDLLNECDLNVSNCIFDAKPLKNSSGEDINIGTEHWDDPSILVGYKATITNNSFYGGSSNVYLDMTLANNQPTIVSGNTFFKYTDRATQNNNGGYVPIWIVKGNSSIVNNSCVFRESRSSQAFVFLAANEILLLNNTCTVMNPSSFGSGGVGVTALCFLTYGNGGPWRVIAENNHLKDLESYAFSNDVGNVGSFFGSIRGPISRGGQPSSTQIWAQNASRAIRMARQFKSQDASTWTVGVTNDGELEVIK